MWLEEIMEFCDKMSDIAVQKVGDLLNCNTTDPLWLWTSSREYRWMKKSVAKYQNAVAGKEGIVGARRSALEELRSAAEAYLAHKGVSLKTCPTYENFLKNDLSKGMSSMELARVEAAYSAHGVALNCSQVADRNPVAFGSAPYNEINKFISKHALFIDRSEDSSVAETEKKMQKEIKPVLFGTKPDFKTEGLLGKAFFTPEDRETVRDVLAKAVILNIIRIGHLKKNN